MYLVAYKDSFLVSVFCDMAEIFQQLVAVFRENSFWMKLYAIDRQISMRYPHDSTVIGNRINLERIRNRIAIDHKRVVSCDAKGLWKACE